MGLAGIIAMMDSFWGRCGTIWEFAFDAGSGQVRTSRGVDALNATRVIVGD